jgi:phosphatidylglycerol:prolipoprotein diacylglycerol transferase
VYCVLAGIERFIVEFFRAKSDMVGPVTSAQVVALAVAAAGVLLMTWRRAPMPAVVPAR